MASTQLCGAAASHIPPVLLIHGRQDTTVPCSSSIGLAHALKLAGAPAVTLHLVAGGGHFDVPVGLSMPAAWRERCVPAAQEAWDSMLAMARGMDRGSGVVAHVVAASRRSPLPRL